MMIRFSIRSLALLFCFGLLALAPTTFAVDGVTLINQNTSVNGLPGCPHTGFPIIICSRGSYRLSGDLRVPDANTSAINVAANDVVLDLNGFTILGPVTCQPGTYPVVCSTSGSGMGVFANSDIIGHTRNVTVRNGNIRGMGAYGILLYRAGSLVDGVHVEWTGSAGGAGISVLSGIVIHCSANTNAGTGIVGGDVINSTAAYNGGYGFDGGISVSDSVASNNGQDGIHNAFLAVNNASTFNIGLGLRFDGNGYGYMGNVIYGNLGGTVTSLGTSLGHNLCNSVAC